MISCRLLQTRLTIPSSGQRAFDGGLSEVDDSEVDDDEEDSAVTTVRAAWTGDGEDGNAKGGDLNFEDLLK